MKKSRVWSCWLSLIAVVGSEKVNPDTRWLSSLHPAHVAIKGLRVTPHRRRRFSNKPEVNWIFKISHFQCWIQMILKITENCWKSLMRIKKSRLLWKCQARILELSINLLVYGRKKQAYEIFGNWARSLKSQKSPRLRKSSLKIQSFIAQDLEIALLGMPRRRLKLFASVSSFFPSKEQSLSYEDMTR